jgi:hypothetical protein
MATPNPTINNDVSYNGGCKLVTWALANGDTGQAVNLASYGTRTVQVAGTFGTGGSVTIEGSNDGTNWFTQVDRAGAALTFTAAGMKTVIDAPIHLRAKCTAGDGTTALSATVAAHRADIAVNG